MDAIVLARAGRALDRVFGGSWIQKVWQDEEGRVFLRLRTASETHLLMVSGELSRPGAGIVEKRSPSREKPRALLSYLRAHLEGGRIEGVRVVPYQRVLKLEVKSREKKSTLILEAVKRTPNIVVLDGEGIVRSALYWETGGGDNVRYVAGAPYLSPPIPEGKYTPDDFEGDFVSLWEGRAKELTDHLIGLPPRLKRWFISLAEGEGMGEAIRNLAALHYSDAPLEIRKKTLALAGELDTSRGSAGEIALLKVCGKWLFAPDEDAGGGSAGVEEKREKRWRKKLEHRLAKIRADIEDAGKPGRLRSIADMVAANLHTIEEKAKSVSIDDPFDLGEKLEVPLDPRLSPGANLDRLYKEVSRGERRVEMARRRLEVTLKEMEAGPPKESSAPGKKGGRADKVAPFARFISSDKWTILLGRNSRENDKLVRESKPWDLWFHVQGGAGAHVVAVKPGKESKVPERTLKEAAGLAALKSKLSTESYVDVIYVEVERLRKVKGGGPGKVLVTGEKVVRVSPGEGNPKPI